jgi:hypothetical protein
MSKPVPVTRLDKSAIDLRRDASRRSDGAVVRRLLANALVVDFHADLTRVFRRELTRVDLWFAAYAGVKFLPFSLRPFVAAELALKRKLSLPVSTMWQ